MLILITIHFSLLTNHSFSQPCFPEGIAFTSQSQINNFQTLYPDCTEIEGNVAIYGSSISNLNGLSVLTSIGGFLMIGTIDQNMGNPLLTGLEGLGNLTLIGDGLTISKNRALVSLQGLNNLNFIGGQLDIQKNISLITLEGLEALTHVEEELDIWDNMALISLNGLENLIEFSGYLFIYGNNSLASLSGLDNITSTETLTIGLNISLASISALGNLSTVGGNLSIYDNWALSTLSGLENLTSIGEDLKINNIDALINLNALSNLSEVGGGIYISDNDALINLEGLENITSIPGDLSIGLIQGRGSYEKSVGNPSLLSLSGLNNLIAVGGNLTIIDNAVLQSLSGLENLTSIAGSLTIGTYAGYKTYFCLGNPSLKNLDGLNNLASVGGDFNLHCNDSLKSMAGLESLTSIAGNLTIGEYIDNSWGTLHAGNPQLTSLSGLENIEANSIVNLQIIENFSLTNCEVQSICDYLAAPNGTIEIHDNAPGCNSPLEVIEACDSITSVRELSFEDTFAISPNPIRSTALIEYPLHQSSPVTLQILDISGRVIETLADEQQQAGNQTVAFDATGLKPGVYFCVLKTSEGIQTKKIIKL